MKVLVTGASGFIGTRFCETFPGKVHKLRRVKSLDEIVDRIKEVNPDCVVHLAGRFVNLHTPADVDDLIESNIKFGARLLEAMDICGVKRIVTAGTYWQYYNGRFPINLYAATKQAFEDILEYYCDVKMFNAATLILHDTYGPRDTRKKLFHALQDKSEIVIPIEDRYIDFVYIDDVCSAISLAVEDTRNNSGKNRYVISTKKSVSLAEAINTWSQVTGSKVTIRRKGNLDRTMKYPVQGHWVPGWKPQYDLEVGLSQTFLT